MAQLELKLPQTPNNDWQDQQYPFDGAWLPDQDPALIGPRNFAILTNLRYNEKSIEGVHGYTKINTTPISTYTDIDNGHQLRTNRDTESFILVHAINPATGQGRVYQNTTLPDSVGDFNTTAKFDSAGNAYKQDTSVGLTGRFSIAPQSSVAYCNGEESFIYSGFEQRIAAAFLQKDDTPANGVKDISEDMNSKLTTESTAFPDGTFDELVIMTTRPVQGFKFYVSSANAAASTSTMQYWNGTAWAAVANKVDGTAAGGVTLAQTGTITFDHTISTVKLKHFQELFLFAYKLTISAGSATVYNITCDPAFIPVQNVWDGVYRQPIQFQVFSADHYEDYTLQVNESSDLNAPIGAQLDGLLATDAAYIMFEEQVAGIRFTMLGDLVNKNAVTMTVYYWDGDSWVDTSAAEGTANGGVTLNQTGLVSWNPPSDEEKQTLFGSLGYAYKIVFSATLTGTKAGTAEVLIDLCAAIPKLRAVGGFEFPVLYKNRLMLGGFSASGQGNRMDYSAPSAPDVFNGTESSDNGLNSLFFGGEEKLTGATQLFNRFGANIFSMLLVFKETETYILSGDNPDDFEVFPVSLVVGCPAPLTIAQTEVSLEGNENLSRNFVIWLSHAGPLMFDGAVVAPVKGIENYFDPNKSEFINWSYISKARGWIDPDYKEYNLLLPTGGATEVDVWLTYDLMRRKWFRKDTATAQLPICGFNVMTPNNGEQHAYGGLGTGIMVHLENGNSWDSTGITQKVRTGDFWPTNNIWDYTLIRKFKIVTKKLVSDTTYDLMITYYNNTELNPGQSVTFVDSDASIGVDVDFTDTTGVEWTEAVSSTTELTLDVGLQRVVTKTIDLNYAGFAHAFEMEVTTDDVNGGFQPIVWGVRFRVERKDDTAN